MRKMLVAVGMTAILGCATLAGTAAAQSPVIGSGTIIGTGAQCGNGLVEVNTGGGTTACVVPTSTTTLPAAQACPGGLVAVDLGGQGVTCVAPDTSGACSTGTLAVQVPGSADLVCVAPTDVVATTDGASCRDGLVPVRLLGGGIGCVAASLVGSAQASGAAGGAGAAGVGGAGSGASATGANGARGQGSGSTTTAATGKTSAGKRVLKPTLSLRKRLRGSTRGLVRSSTKKVVVTVVGRRHGRVVRFTRQVSLRRTAALTASRPYSARVRIVVKTKGKIRIRVTSRGTGSVKSADLTRTVRR
jgi:hypothetical protein